jgi:hypothetical protein
MQRLYGAERPNRCVYCYTYDQTPSGYGRNAIVTSNLSLEARLYHLRKMKQPKMNGTIGA